MYVKHLLSEKEQQNPSFNRSKASQSPSHSDAEGYSVYPSWGLDLSVTRPYLVRALLS